MLAACRNSPTAGEALRRRRPRVVGEVLSKYHPSHGDTGGL
ncbi:MAG: hypothetical protein M5R38_19035 [Candidatus Methylomirabilis sp.]|nr:hypothetical protein [Candidatus Methylomirabilis sp.]